MVNIQGSYYLQIGIDNSEYTDFINVNNLSKFAFEEYSGGTLPIFQLVFTCIDMKLFQFLHGVSVLTIVLGVSREDSFITKMRIMNRTFSRESDGALLVNIIGELNLPDFTITPRVEIIKTLSAIEAIQETALNYFNIDSNIDKSDDVQNWIKYGITDKVFIDQTWLHSFFIDGGTPIISYSSDFYFVVRNILQSIKEQAFDWILYDSSTLLQGNENEILVNSNYSFVSSNYASNITYGYDSNITDIDNEYSYYTSLESKPKPITSTSNYEKLENIQRKVKSLPINDNVHKYFNVAFMENTTRLALMSTIQIELTITNSIYYPLRAGQVVLFQSTSKDLSPYLNGVFIIENVKRTITNTGFFTKLKIVKEALNETVTDSEEIY